MNKICLAHNDYNLCTCWLFIPTLLTFFDNFASAREYICEEMEKLYGRLYIYLVYMLRTLFYV